MIFPIIIMLSFDEDLFLLRNRFFILLGKDEIQDTVLEGCLDVFFSDVLADIEASLHRSGVALLPYQLALLVLFVFIKTLVRADDKISVIELQTDFLLLEAGQVDVYLVMVVMLVDICLHHPVGMPAVKLSFGTVHVSEIRECEPVVKQILSKNTRS